MNAQVGHADIVGVGIDEGDREPAPPVFDDGARFAGKPLFVVFYPVPCHTLYYILTPHLFISPFEKGD
ncbi:hypothetical protein LCGC14_2938020 [marine sediment metagenome]|uniref:Uncharacterized protein n=1 Tax=marine sediment metagenome TaxID=412755 RepID=A0A0F8ZRN2_9ZZZZ